MLRLALTFLLAAAPGYGCLRSDPPTSNAGSPKPAASRHESPPSAAVDVQSVLDDVLSTVDRPIAAVVIDLAGEARIVASAGRRGLDPTQVTMRPGSTVKPLLAAIAADRGVLEPLHQHECTGTYAADPSFTCFASHGPLDLADALMLSCNSYFYELADQLGYTAIQAGFSAHGLGKATGLREGEVNGHLPSESALAAIAKADHRSQIQAARVVGIGHGALEVTLVQLAHAYGNLAVRMHAIERDDSISPPEQTLLAIQDGLRRTVQHPQGTGTSAAVPGLCVAGKTGTVDAEEGPDAEQSGLFVAFAPATNPRLVVAVAAQGGTGPNVAAPVAGAFFKRWLALGGIEAAPCPPADEVGPPC